MKTKLILFTLSALILLLIPLMQILRYETVIAKGRSYIFKCEPYDPYDPFRGRYVRIRIENEVKLGNTVVNTKNQWRGISGWTRVEKGKSGLAKCTGFSLNKPKSGEYVKCNLRKVWDGKGYNKWRVQLEVDRVFMNEKLAPKAEAAQRKNECSVELKIYEGKVVPIKLLMNNKPMVEQLKQKKNERSL